MSAEEQKDVQQFSLLKDQAYKAMRSTIQEILQDKSYQTTDAEKWANKISDNCVKSLKELSKNFKYIVNTIIVQKSNYGLNLSGSCFWDQETDGNESVVWENQTMTCIVNAYATAL